jgi:thiamine-monophosphate kinase
MCEASGVRAEIEIPPIYPGATLSRALHGGEDYELLFTVGPRVKVAMEFEGLPITRIGTMRRGRPRVEFQGQPLEALGWDHFRE